MNEEQLKALLTAAQTLGINPNDLKAENPWKFDGARAESIQAAIAQQNPGLAAKWRQESGQKLSLGAIAARDGITTMTNAQHEELLSLDADYATGAQEAQSRLEASLLDKYSQAAEELAAAREKQRQSFAQSSGSTSTGSFNNDFLKRIGGQQGLNMPARRLTGN